MGIVLIDMEQLTSFFGNFKSESSQFKAVKSLTASLQGLLHTPLIFIFNEVVKKINPEQSFCFHFLLEEGGEKLLLLQLRLTNAL